MYETSEEVGSRRNEGANAGYKDGVQTARSTGGEVGLCTVAINYQTDLDWDDGIAARARQLLTGAYAE